MQNLLKKAHWFNSTKQQKPSLSRNISSGLEYAAKVYSHGEDSESQSPEQDFSLTLSTCMARNKSRMHGVLSEPGLGGIYGSRVESCLRSFLQSDNADYAIHQAQLDFSQSVACISYPWSESYFGRIIAAYGPNAVIYPQRVGMTPPRVPLPTQRTESFPLFVNAKQYPAILRRRKIRAKLEAQNKLAKSRKPYLHESRHLHAQRRARGSGGRFLNTKIMPHPKPPSTSVTYKSHQQLSNVSRSEVQHSSKQQLETSTLSSSDITTIFNGYDIFQHTERNAPWEGFSPGKT